MYKLLLILSLLINNETDKNIYCKDWSQLGECNTNPNYMLKYCQSSCLNNLLNKTLNFYFCK
jgi:hypothetical protein